MTSRTVPIQGTLEKIKGWGTLTIFQMSASPYWYARFYADGKIHKRSLKTKEKREAIRLAKDFFSELKAKQMGALPVTPTSGFEACARGLMKENEARVARGDIAQSKIDNDRLRLEKDLLPFFRKYQVGDIDYAKISEYCKSLSTASRALSSNSLKIHLSQIKTILKYAQQLGAIKSLPAFPSLPTVDKPRNWFTAIDYNRLHNTARVNIGRTFKKTDKNGGNSRNITLTDELYDLILFMTNTFIRPSDLKVLQHKHVTIVPSRETFLRLTHPATKGHHGEVVSMPNAVGVYQRLLNRQVGNGYGKPEDYLFQPQHAANRSYALRELERQFDQLLELTNLKTDVRGESRSLYSLRHTGIMFRLINAEGMTLLTLARNARTSTEMIERFYAKHLTAEMVLSQIHSQKPRKVPVVKRGATKTPAPLPIAQTPSTELNDEIPQNTRDYTTGSP